MLWTNVVRQLEIEQINLRIKSILRDLSAFIKSELLSETSPTILMFKAACYCQYFLFLFFMISFKLLRLIDRKLYILFSCFNSFKNKAYIFFVKFKMCFYWRSNYVLSRFKSKTTTMSIFEEPIFNSNLFTFSSYKSFITVKAQKRKVVPYI